MKKTMIFFFIFFLGSNLFSENYNYGLHQEDLNLLLGFFGSVDARGTWDIFSFSWGTQNAFFTEDRIFIDYDARASSVYGMEYENHLLIFESGLIFLILNIEKISSSEFIISTAYMEFDDDIGLKVDGRLLFTFIDDRHVKIDNLGRVKNQYKYNDIFWKSTGPDVLTNSDFAISVLQDSENGSYENEIIGDSSMYFINSNNEIIQNNTKSSVINRYKKAKLFVLLLVISMIFIVIFFVMKKKKKM